MTTYLTINTCRGIVSAQTNAIELGMNYRAACVTARRDALRETALIARDWFADSHASAKENIAALRECRDAMLEDLRAAEPGVVIPGCNHDGKNAIDNGVVFMWNANSDKPVLASSCAMDFTAMCKHFNKAGSLPKLAAKWLALDEAKQFHRKAKGPSAPKPKHVAKVIKAITDKGLTVEQAAEVMALIESFSKAS